MIGIAILTISDSVVVGTREDLSGAALQDRIQSLRWQLVNAEVVADEIDLIAGQLRTWADAAQIDVILTTGGTGVAPRDVTPEATRQVIDREIPGLGEVMRAEGRKSTPYAALSRAVSGSRGTTLIVNLPGSPKGAVESLDAVADLIPHIVDLLHGKTQHTGVGDPKHTV